MSDLNTIDDPDRVSSCTPENNDPRLSDNMNEPHEHPKLDDGHEGTNQPSADSDSESSKQTTNHRISETEERWYYFGLRGNAYTGWAAPRLIYRTSKDILPPPYSTYHEVRQMKLLTVHDHEKLSKNNLWDTVRDETAGILDRNQIKFTSIDLVRFRLENSSRSSPGPEGYTTTGITIWIGVLPYSTSTTKAFEASQEILKLLEQHGIDDFEIAFRESACRPFARDTNVLYAPAKDYDPCKEVIESLTTAISLPIVAVDSANTSEGTLGFYFKAGEDLYGVTTRHLLFQTGEGNEMYTDDISQSKKYVALMSPETSERVRKAVSDKIDQITKRMESETPSTETEQTSKDEMQAQIAKLEELSVALCRDWIHLKDRIIGHVVWSPPISGLGNGSPEGYLRDVCVIKLDKDMFMPNMVGNSMDIGTWRDLGQFLNAFYPRKFKMEYPKDFILPFSGLYDIARILPVSQMNESNVRDREGHPTRVVVRGESTSPVISLQRQTTNGLLNGYMSRVRHYNLSGVFDSIEMAIFPYDIFRSPFSTPGNSGSAIVGSNNDFVAQLTSGTGSSEMCDINYATPMEWLWNDVIKPEFPGADLFFWTPNYY